MKHAHHVVSLFFGLFVGLELFGLVSMYVLYMSNSSMVVKSYVLHCTVCLMGGFGGGFSHIYLFTVLSKNFRHLIFFCTNFVIL